MNKTGELISADDFDRSIKLLHLANFEIHCVTMPLKVRMYLSKENLSTRKMCPSRQIFLGNPVPPGQDILSTPGPDIYL